MAETPPVEKSIAERWFEEQQAWQKTMREYADAMATDENFLQHLGNAMRGSLLAGTAYPQANGFGEAAADPRSNDSMDEVLFTLKRIEGRLSDLEAAISALTSAGGPTPSKPDHADR
ncbi:hypothetical protein JT358_08580 [Micrococcales bacterium 31B]|nr:hypothetical protein [Micrococcales bacterium 31B]